MVWIQHKLLDNISPADAQIWNKKQKILNFSKPDNSQDITANIAEY